MKSLLIQFLIVFSGCFISTAAFAQSDQSLVILSGRKEPLIEPVTRLFEEKTGIRVIVKTGESFVLGQQIIQERNRPSADIYIAKEAGSLEDLRLKGAFEPYLSVAIQKVPRQFRAIDGSWVGVSARSRAVIYNKDLIADQDLPRSFKDLVDPKYKGKIAAANSGNESIIAWISAMRLALGDAVVLDWLKAMKHNAVALLSKSHTDVRKSVGRGEYPLGLINHYYYHLQRHESDPVINNVGIIYLDQQPGQQGEFINVSGAAIIKGAPHAELARQFMDFLVSEEAQKIFAQLNYEFPLVPGIPTHPEVMQALSCQKQSALECINAMNVPLDSLGAEMENSLQMLESVDWN